MRSGQLHKQVNVYIKNVLHVINRHCFTAFHIPRKKKCAPGQRKKAGFRRIIYIECKTYSI